VDYLSLGAGAAVDKERPRRASAAVCNDALVDLLFRRDVGIRRTYVWLTMRYLGMSLGMGVALGYCSAFGTLIPPLFPQLFPKGAVFETLVRLQLLRRSGHTGWHRGLSAGYCGGGSGRVNKRKRNA